MNEAVYVKVTLLEEPRPIPDSEGYTITASAVEFTHGLPIPLVVSILRGVADALEEGPEGGEG